jgi:predicted Rossmann-fold nucleotide-binding protein
VKLFISCPLGLGTKNEIYNVLALGCLGRVEPNILLIMPFKPLVKLRFGFVNL